MLFLYLFYWNVDGKLFIFIHRTSICTDVIMQRSYLFIYSWIEFYLASLNLFMEVHIFWPHYVMFVLFLIVGPHYAQMLWCWGLLFTYFQLWNGMQYPIPKVWQVVLPNVDPPKILQKQKHQQEKTNKKRQNQSPIKKRCHIVVQYSQGISESIKNICQRYGIQVHFKGGATIKNLLVSPKDKDSITKKSSVIYWFKCDKIDCEEEYIGESSRTFGERYREHLKAPSPIYEHQNNIGHITSLENFKIIGRGCHNMARAVK